MHPIKKAVLFAIDLYRAALSPVLPASCRFTPSCSCYTREAVERYGTLHGLYMGIKRILRCHPFHRGGHDPVR
jgi:putative membrane protein insertion efficiency factor